MSNNRVQIGFVGPWLKAKRILNGLPLNLKKAGISAQRSIAESYIRKIKSHLLNQDIPGWTPLNPKYADYKMGKYGHEDILIASRAYYESIKAWRKDNVYYAGVPSELTYDNGVSISRVGFIHEKWSQIKGKPHRPLWDYTLNNDMGGEIGINKLMIKLVHNKLR